MFSHGQVKYCILEAQQRREPHCRVIINRICILLPLHPLRNKRQVSFIAWCYSLLVLPPFLTAMAPGRLWGRPATYSKDLNMLVEFPGVHCHGIVPAPIVAGTPEHVERRLLTPLPNDLLTVESTDFGGRRGWAFIKSRHRLTQQVHISLLIVGLQ
ncbi:hypothetical protein KC19_VG230500 [Ceratodon purpureus]|uniref:Uncharacterized protein n=1 Tax=Ceratodon purpureus TaxID=3225 RepID=A0A8T0HT79_CERPU|nr:hypothetical protein KC19_VG230500 [Ceratodon purpureus]